MSKLAAELQLEPAIFSLEYVPKRQSLTASDSPVVATSFRSSYTATAACAEFKENKNQGQILDQILDW